MDIICTGNNGNGCFMDSCGHDCGCEGIITEERDLIGEMSKYQKLYDVCLSKITSLLNGENCAKKEKQKK